MTTSTEPPASEGAPPSSVDKPLRELLRAGLVLVLTALLVLWALASLRPPPPVSASAPEAEFASARAMRHLVTIAQRPRRIGSAWHEQVRAYLEDELRSLGLDVEVQRTVVVQLRYQDPRQGLPARVAAVQNVVARMRGTRGPTAKAVLLMAHYDSRSMTPGAADDGLGTVALLESARALKAGPAPGADILFVFTDGEEEGLLGAKAFVDEHPWAKDVGVVLNFDARGDAGPVLMFQTSDGNGALIDELARAAPTPVANSLTQAIYKRMPNDSDLTEWLRVPGVRAMNFANIDGFESYHSPTDDVTNLDEGTLQHHGSYALAMARAFANESPPSGARADATYFNVGPFFLHYPESLARPLGAAALVAFVGALALGTRRRMLVWSGLGLGFAWAIGSLAGAALVANAAWSLLRGAHPEYALFVPADRGMKMLYLGAFAAIAVFVTSLLGAVVPRRMRTASFALGAAGPWALLAPAVAWLEPGGAFLLAWPSLAASCAWLARLGLAFEAREARTVALHLAAGLLPIMLYVPLAAQLFIAFGPPTAPFVALTFTFALLLLAPVLEVLLQPNRAALPVLAGAAAVACLLAAHATPSFGGRYPRPDTLFLAVDADQGKASWASPDDAPDAWTGKVLADSARGAARSSLPAFFPLRPGPTLLVRDAPYTGSLVSAPPSVVVLADALEGGHRALTLRAMAPARTELMVLYADKGPRILDARIDGRSVPTFSDGTLAFYYSAPPEAGVDVTIELEQPGPIFVRLVAQQAGFPEELARAVGQRQETPEAAALMPKPGSLPPWDEMEESDMTLLARSFSF